MAALVASRSSSSENIPIGTGHEEDPLSRSVDVLSEELIWKELRFLAKPQSTQFDAEKGWRADSINFQPSNNKSQDRYVCKRLVINWRVWELTGVFDGHLGDVTAEHVSKHLPIIVGEFLQHAFDNGPSRLDDPSFISDCLSRSILAFDKAIAGDVLDLFPGGLANYTDAQIRQIINDQHKGGSNFRKARLNMYGTTALVALVDPDHRNLWIANVGDCQASLVSPTPSGEWDVQILTSAHNGDNDAEVARVRHEHANEPSAVMNGRILGAIHPFRSFGDTPFKQPPEFTRRILFNLLPGFHDTSPWEEFLARNLTPPYITATPEILHFSLDESHPNTFNNDSSSPSLPRFLILCSDGFTDLCSSEGQQRIVSDWAHGVANMQSTMKENSSSTERSNINNFLPMSPPVTSYLTSPFGSTSMSVPSMPGHESRNMALRLLRRALGGDDRASVSRILTLDMDVAWIDDTSIVVQTL